MALPIGTPRPCKGCGKTIFKLKFCTNECREDWYARTSKDRERARNADRGIPSWKDRYGAEYGSTLVERDCEVCGKHFSRRKRPDDAARCCSRECGFELARQRGEVSRLITAEKRLYAKWARRSNPKTRDCIECGCEVSVFAKFCETCKPRNQPKACRDCSTEVPKHAQRCEPCRAKAERKAKRASRAARDKRIKAATVETFDPFEVFDRDKWRCHICGVKTPKRLRGTYEDNAPELDHIIPLAAGGEHSRRNTACSCRKCNIAKSDKPLGQLRLVA